LPDHYSIGRLGLFATSILVLSSACAVGEIGGGPGGARFGAEDGVGSSPVEPSNPTALSCAGASPDVAARNGWRSSDAGEPATGALSFELKARPTAANLDGLVALGAESIDEFDKAAITVRFAENGLVDVRDGAFYASDTRYEYKPGVWYSIAVSADIENRVYDVEIGPCGEPRETLIREAAFRNDATVADELGAWAVWSSQSASLEVSTPAWMPSGACVPTTCDSLGHECGQPSDGCGGVLDCGGCANDQLCDTGRCAEGLVSTPASPDCVPDTCDSIYRECGAVSDGCGGTLSCGTCGTGDRCTGWGTCVAVVASASAPALPACTPDTCENSFRECGVASDGCGGTLSCGTCGAGENCTSWGSCVAVVPPEPTPPTCTPKTCQAIGRECGSASNGCGGTLNCGGCGSGELCSSGMCVADSSSTPSPPPPSSGGSDPKGRGPTGQWPPGFPPYASTADVITSGSLGSLQSALTSGACSGGCVVEHPGNIPEATLTRAGSGEIVVRPPIGRRSDFAITGAVHIRGADLLVAGYSLNSNMRVVDGTNSGFAWMESNNGSGRIDCHALQGGTTSCIFYELVYRDFRATGDRGQLAADNGGSANMLIVGSIITGDPSGLPAHADNVQVYHAGGGTGYVTIRDSVIWPGWDKAFQGQSENFTFDLYNIWITSPSLANSLWPGGSLGYSQPYHTTAVADFHNSTINGPAHSGHVVRVWDSEIYNWSTYTNMGGNKTVGSTIAPPAVPSHTQLDAIWSP